MKFSLSALFSFLPYIMSTAYPFLYSRDFKLILCNGPHVAHFDLKWATQTPYFVSALSTVCASFST